MSQPLATRQIHLDFHTGPNIPDVGVDFDAKAFAKAMKQASVTSVTLFAKCHHGHLYYNTKRPERHPGLSKRLDLLGEQVEALHREGIRAPIYLSVQCDEYAANTHPEWVARKPDGSQVKSGDSVFAPGWQILDMATPYQDFLYEQTEEVLKTFKPVDGIFFDMTWDQPSTTKEFMAQMVKEDLNPEVEADRNRYAHLVALRYMKRFHGLVRSHSKDAHIYFNSRPLNNLAEEIDFFGQVEIEALPSGGWGYMYFPKNVRFARTFPKPYLGMTARFHKSWADFGGLKPYAALEYETAQMLAHGASCSIGDQMHPRGTLDKGAYALIGKAYAQVAEREPWCLNATAVVDIGVFQNSAGYGMNANGTDEGAVRMLTQLKHQFNVIAPASSIDAYKLLILPDGVAVDAALAKRLSAFVKAGGSLLCTGTSGLSADGTEVLLPELGIVAHGLSPFTTTYIRFDKAISAGVADSDHVNYEKGVRVTAAKGTTTLARVVEPYFERAYNHFSSHFQTPGDKLSKYVAATVRGRVACIPFPIFAAHATHGSTPYRQLVERVLAQLLPEPLVRITAPTSTEVSVMFQKAHRRTVTHLLQYCPERRTGNLDLVEDIVPIYNIPLAVRLARTPKRAYLAPSGEELHLDWHDDRASVVVPEVNGHAMVVFE